MKRRDNEDAREWASSIGSDTIDIVDAAPGSIARRPLKAPMPMKVLAELREKLSQGKVPS